MADPRRTHPRHLPDRLHPLVIPGREVTPIPAARLAAETGRIGRPYRDEPALASTFRDAFSCEAAARSVRSPCRTAASGHNSVPPRSDAAVSDVLSHPGAEFGSADGVGLGRWGCPAIA
jgi:hypothetical protein